jgi:hypothetical protein
LWYTLSICNYSHEKENVEGWLNEVMSNHKLIQILATKMMINTATLKKNIKRKLKLRCALLWSSSAPWWLLHILVQFCCV